MRPRAFLTLGLLLAAAPAVAQDDFGYFHTFGVPSSPAFELLPNKPTEVTHVVTGSDVKASFAQLVVDSKLGTSASIDIRPFAFGAGALRDYQADRLRRLAWRSVLAVGTAPAGDESGDVFGAVGLRIPILDRGDPRLDTAYLRALEAAVAAPFNEQPPHPDRVDSDWIEDRLRGSAREDSIREAWASRNWNAERLEVGLAASARVRSAALEPDSAVGDRFGAWLAYARGLSTWGEVTLNAKTAGVRAVDAGDETRRDVLGARLRVRPFSWLAIAAEGAQVWSHRDGAATADWTHLAVGLELPTGFLSDWLGEGWILVAVGQGTDTEEDGLALELEYTVNRNRTLP
jgi:hypothetical protein